jgi:hypothetical protein
LIQIKGRTGRPWHDQKMIRFSIAALASAILRSSCIALMPALRADRTVTIPGRLTAGLAPSDATRKAMSEAARLTLDHGFRYFMLASNGPGAASVLPGKNIVFKVYHKGDIRLNTPGLLDADAILAPGR